MRHNKYFAQEATSLGGRVLVFLGGMGAGLAVVLFGALVIWALGGLESGAAQVDVYGISPYGISPYLGAAVAAGVAASKTGASGGRVVRMALLALVGAFFIDYVLFFALVASSSFDRLVRFYVVRSLATTTAGTFLGMTFGRGGAPRQEWLEEKELSKMQAALEKHEGRRRRRN